jgi:hypothetical protein
MLALLLIASATAAGTYMSARLRLEYGAWTRFAIGTAFAQLLLLFVPFYFAYAFDLGVRRAGVVALCVLGVAGAAGWIVDRRELTSLLRELAATSVARRQRPIVAFGACFMALIAWLHYTHYLRPEVDGLHSAGVTWGDLPLHAGLASRFLKAEGLPALEHPLFFHGPLIYPFLPDYSVAVLAGLGLDLRWAFIAGGTYGVASLVLMLHAVTRAWLGGTRRLEPILVLALFFFAGGFGFVWIARRVLGGAALIDVLRTTNATYDVSPHIAKAGHIGNLFLASRCAAYGMPIGLAALLVLGAALDATPRRRAALIAAGAATGALPLVHTHSFLVISGVVLWQLATCRPRARVAQLASCCAPLLLVALPQLLFLSGGAERSFVRFEPGFLRPAPTALDWLLDLVLGMGLGWLLLPWALRSAQPRLRLRIAPLLLLLPLANLVAFAPAAYDAIKLVAWFDVGAAVLLAGWLAPRLRAAATTRLWAGTLLVACTLSGVLAVGFELCNDTLAVSRADVELAALVEAHTPPDAVIATAASYHDPVVMLAGRRALMAAPFMSRLNGIDVSQRAIEILKLYAGGPTARALIARFGVFAVVIGPAERADLPVVDEAFFARVARATYEAAGRRLYVLGGASAALAPNAPLSRSQPRRRRPARRRRRARSPRPAA